MTLSGTLLDSTRLLFDLQQINEIAQSFSGYLEPELIARAVTEGLVERFRCAFVRIWLLEPNQTQLRLVASSGMYTHTNGFFGRVPMGAYKVGKIAQNRVSFLSNNLPAESWVGDREWAIANQIQGFAGYPLAIGSRVIGVVAVFSHQPLAAEFLEVLQTLCTIATIALETALQHQKEKQHWELPTAHVTRHLALSDQLAEILDGSRLTLLGTEQPLSMSSRYFFLRTAEILHQLNGAYARLIYSDRSAVLEAIVPTLSSEFPGHIHRSLLEIQTLVNGAGGILETQPISDQRALKITLSILYHQEQSGTKLEISCISRVLQAAFTQLALTAGLTLCRDEDAPLLTDDVNAIAAHRAIIWIHQSCPCPPGIRAKVGLSIQAEQLQQVVEAVLQGQTWGLQSNALSDRELEILSLLTQGHRDRDIADQLVISESTVKFHLNNVLTKLKARTRYQAVYLAIEQGWI